MNLMAAFFSGALADLVGFFVKYLGKKVAIGAAFVTAFLALTGAFFLALKAIITGFVFVADNRWLTIGFYLCWPANAEAVIAACFSADIAAFLYRVHVDFLRMQVAATA